MAKAMSIKLPKKKSHSNQETQNLRMNLYRTEPSGDDWQNSSLKSSQRETTSKHLLQLFLYQRSQDLKVIEWMKESGYTKDDIKA